MISKIGLGTAQLGQDYGINNKKRKILKREAFQILEYAFKNGIGMLDTAYIYGDSEQLLGEFIQKQSANFKVVSKLMIHDLAQIEVLFNESLSRLNMNKIYGYLIHNFDFFLEHKETWDILMCLKDKGKIKKIGFSLYYPEQAEYLLEENIQVDILQIPFSILDQRFSVLLPKLKERFIEIHTRSVFLQGLVFSDPHKLNDRFTKIRDKLCFLKSISKERNMPISAICINFVLLNEFIDQLIFGVDSVENLHDNISAFNFQNQVKEIYPKLLDLHEDDENITVPVNW